MFRFLSQKKIFAFLIFIIAIVVVAYIFFGSREGESYKGLDLDKDFVSYEEVQPDSFDIKVLEDSLGSITRIKITPDSKVMLVTDLAGKVWAFTKEGDSFSKQDKPFYEVDTGFTGFPIEKGLTGLAFGADFEQSKDIFLLYMVDTKDGAKNRVTRITFTEDKSGNFVGEDPEDIFDSNVEPVGAHQIQDGVGVMIKGEPHLLFSLGENFRPEDALDLAKESGKLMLIQTDGSDPLGERPYPEYPKVQTIGLRNAYGLNFDPNDSLGRLAIVDNGPVAYDRFLYARVIDQAGEKIGGLNFQWDGTDESLAKSVKDTNTSGSPEAILKMWEETVSANEVIFHPGQGVIPSSTSDTSYALVLLFGMTGTMENERGKELTLAKIENLSSSPAISFTPLIKRREAATDFAGNPLGLAYDPETLKIYFGDIVEGRLYEADPI